MQPKPVLRRTTKGPLIMGWISICVSCFWAFWGSMETSMKTRQDLPATREIGQQHDHGERCI